jgi:hypothetical protein
MRYRIIRRLEKAGAISEETAVTIEEAGFDLEEQQWLGYFAGGSLQHNHGDRGRTLLHLEMRMHD